MFTRESIEALDEATIEAARVRATSFMALYPLESAIIASLVRGRGALDELMGE
jgi:hypothetical protein